MTSPLRDHPMGCMKTWFFSLMIYICYFLLFLPQKCIDFDSFFVPEIIGIDLSPNAIIANTPEQDNPLRFSNNSKYAGTENSIVFNKVSKRLSKKVILTDEAVRVVVGAAVNVSSFRGNSINFLCTSQLESTENARVTLFTTIKISSKTNPVFCKTIEHWSKLRPFVQPVLFVVVKRERGIDTKKVADDISKIASKACRSGWDVTVAQNTDKYGHPFLKNMFMHSFNSFPTRWHGYCNSDILLDQSFVRTLMYFDTKLTRSSCKNILLAGRRHDIEVCLHLFQDIVNTQ